MKKKFTTGSFIRISILLYFEIQIIERNPNRGDLYG